MLWVFICSEYVHVGQLLNQSYNNLEQGGLGLGSHILWHSLYKSRLFDPKYRLTILPWSPEFHFQVLDTLFSSSTTRWHHYLLFPHHSCWTSKACFEQYNTASHYSKCLYMQIELDFWLIWYARDNSEPKYWSVNSLCLLLEYSKGIDMTKATIRQPVIRVPFR